jgi:predicted nucleotidyltransferase
MKTEIKILKSMLDNREEITINGLSLKLVADYKIVHTACLRLIEKGILNAKKVGRAKQLSLNNTFSREVFEAEFERREEILRDKNLKLLVQEIHKNLNYANFILLLFGSYAKKSMDKRSDIDLVFIVPNIALEKDVDRIISLIPLKVHHFVFTEGQFNKMKNNREPNVIKEVIKTNIILYGIEQYYAIIGREHD